MTLIGQKNGYEVWVYYDRTAEVYEMFASDEGGDYIGCADSLSEAQQFAKNWLIEQVEGG